MLHVNLFYLREIVYDNFNIVFIMNPLPFSLLKLNKIKYLLTINLIFKEIYLILVLTIKTIYLKYISKYY